MSVLQVDVKQTIGSKNKQLAKWLPRFVIRWIERIIHQDEINSFLAKHKHDNALEFANYGLKEFAQASISVTNEEKIPKEGRYIVVSNHPLGGIDGLALISLIGKYRSDIKFPVNDLLMEIKPMHGIFIPINKHGRNDKNAAMELHHAFASNDLILYFPAGICSRKIKGKIQDVEWKKTIIQKAKEYQRDIVPVFFEGRNSEWFYCIANLRKRLGIKANLEMILLPGEMLKQKGNRFSVTFGEPVSYATFDFKRTPKEWAVWLQAQAIKLADTKYLSFP
jgi:1-acyl-sn-glycerol-3-phosphate acyltransferase